MKYFKYIFIGLALCYATVYAASPITFTQGNVLTAADLNIATGFGNNSTAIMDAGRAAFKAKTLGNPFDNVSTANLSRVLSSAMYHVSLPSTGKASYCASCHVAGETTTVDHLVGLNYRTGEFIFPECTENQVLKKNATSWVCADSFSPTTFESYTSNATGTGSPVRAGSPVVTTPSLVLTGTSLTAGSVYYMSGSGLALAKGDAASTLPAICMAISTTQCAYSGVYTTGTWTQGQQLYVSTATAGALTATAPSSGFLQKFGVAATSNSVLVIPAITIVGL